GRSRTGCGRTSSASAADDAPQLGHAVTWFRHYGAGLGGGRHIDNRFATLSLRACFEKINRRSESAPLLAACWVDAGDSHRSKVGRSPTVIVVSDRSSARVAR